MRAGRETRSLLYLRYEFWDAEAGTTRYAREYVPKRELARVRRWVRRHRAAATAFGWGEAGLRRILGQRLTRPAKGFC